MCDQILVVVHNLYSQDLSACFINWVNECGTCLFSQILVGGKGGSREYSRLQKQSIKILEENHLLKYKVDLLLDMLAASNADCLVMQKELDAIKRANTLQR